MQTRDFTYVSDAVEATYRAALADASNEVLNIGGGSRVSLAHVLGILGQLTDVPPRVRFMEAQPGDVRDTAADVNRAASLIDFRPQVPLSEGLRRQVEFVRRATAAVAG